MVYKLMQGSTIEEIKETGAGPYYVDYDRAVHPSTGTGVPFTAAYIQSKDDVLADIHEDMADEQKARTTYEHLINLADDPDVLEPLRFLRAREIVHFQRFGEIMGKLQEYLDKKVLFIVLMY